MGLNAGELRVVVSVAAPGPNVPDGEGGYTQVPVPLTPPTWRASIQKASVRSAEARFAATVIAHATHILSGRYHPGISTRTVLTWTDRFKRVHTANVLDLDDDEGAGVMLTVLASEIVT